MTLNGVMAVIMGYFTEFGSFEANYVKLVEVRRKLCDHRLGGSPSMLYKP